MPACPNCGRETLRTIDWACQWCGYPLISRAYKKIDKTFKELQEERNLTSKSAQPQEKPGTQYPPEPEPPAESRPPEKPVYQPIPEPEPAPAPEPEPEPAPEPKPEVAPEAVEPPVQSPQADAPPPTEPPQAQTQPVIELPPPEPQPAPTDKTEIAPAPEPIVTPPPPPPPEQELPPTPQPIITPPPQKPEIKTEPEPAADVKLEEIQDDMKISTDQIDALFRADKSAAHAKFTDKTLVINGIVEKVFVREHLEIRYIMLAGIQKKMMWNLRCTFEKEESSKLTSLSEGQSVTLRGKYDGYRKNIIFKECTLL